MKRFFKFFNKNCGCILFQMVICFSLIIPNSSSAKNPRYPNTYAKDFMADAPWRVKGTTAAIPVGFFIKDSDVNDLPDLDSAEIYLWRNRRWERIYHHNFGGISLNRFAWEWVATEFENAENSKLNGKPMTAENLGFDTGDVIELKAWIEGRDDWWQGGAFSFSRRLRIRVETSFPRPDSDWMYGDTHYHTKYTANPYEYGGGLETLKLALKALDLDWITITDHASDYSDWDLNARRWNELKAWIERNNNISGLPFIIGEEITCQARTGSDNIHLLVYNNDKFISGEIDGLNNAQLSLYSRLNELNAEGLAFSAHPADSMDIMFVGDIVPWSDANIATALLYDNYYGLEVWNTRKTMESPGGNLDHINPFTSATGGWESKLSKSRDHHFLPNLEISIKKWVELLESHLNPIRKIVIEAGSDAHGDLNYFSYMDFNWERLGTNDNAIGKARTLVYAPERSKNSVLEGLKNGNSIITDGPVILIGIDKNGDGKLDKGDGDHIVGDIAFWEDNVEILISWIAYNDVGINNIKLFLGKNLIHEFDPADDNSVFGNDREGYKVFQLSSDPRQTNQYLRAECVSQAFLNRSGFSDRYRAYTNPLYLSYQTQQIPLSCHSADYQPQDNKISLSELLRVIQLYNHGAYHCLFNTDDGEWPTPDMEDEYALGKGNQDCAHHSSDYKPQDWSIGLSELLRLIQLYNSPGGYHADENGEDGFVTLK